jgi:hypothetical protein
VTAHFVDAPDILDHAIRCVQSLHRLVTRCADLFYDTPIRFVLRIECENSLAGRIENHLAERDPSQFSIFIQQPWDELVDRRV